MVDNIIFLSVVITMFSLIIAVTKFISLPDVLNKVVSFDIASIITISLIAIIASLLERFIYVDVAIVYALLSFLGVLVVARYFERGL